MTRRVSESRENREMLDAYPDIETTGLSCEYAGITVIGICLLSGADSRLVQLVGMDGGMPARFARGGA